VRGQEDPVDERDVVAPSELSGTFDLERTRGQRLRRLVLRIRPLVEVAEVLRSRPPLPRTPVDGDRDLPAPTIRHASQGVWRAHIAGVRGVGEGAAASAIVLAGVEMGFNVRAVNLPESIGAGRSAWAQVLFMHAGRDERPPTRTAGVPSGDADLVLGVDPIETVRALGFDPQLRVASSERTSIVANLEPLADQQDDTDAAIAGVLRECAQAQCIPSSIQVRAFASVVERQFGNERLLDMVMLGIAFQSGLIPVSPAAMRHGVARVEESSFGRSSEAFDFGRQLGEGERRARSTEPTRTVQAVLREVVLETRFSRGTREAMRLRDRLQRALDRMPGLLETEPGRRATIDFLSASAGLLRWGNRRAVESFVETIEDVYRSDRGDTGRELTRNVVLVLGEALLIRDLPYAASVALSVEHRLRVRRRLGVRTGRGDALEVAYLIRADLQALGFRLRVHLPAREGLLRLVMGIGRVLPDSIRGATLDRTRRTRILAAVGRARSEAQDPVRYRAWCAHFRRLRDHVTEGSFHALTISELDA
jgi:indolepyruvate ferredoxin oxidoreductase